MRLSDQDLAQMAMNVRLALNIQFGAPRVDRLLRTDPDLMFALVKLVYLELRDKYVGPMQ